LSWILVSLLYVRCWFQQLAVIVADAAAVDDAGDVDDAADILDSTSDSNDSVFSSSFNSTDDKLVSTVVQCRRTNYGKVCVQWEVMGHRCKKTFLRFFFHFGHVFTFYNVFFYFLNVFFFKKRWQSWQAG